MNYQDYLKKIQSALNERPDNLADTGDGYRLIDKRINLIVRLYKYRLKWSRSGFFAFVLQTFPDLRERLTGWEIKHSKTSALFQLLDNNQKSKIIKRLLMLEKKL